MKKALFALAIMAVAALFMSACKVVTNEEQGDLKEKIYNVGQFTSIENNGFIDVEYIPSDTFEVKLSAPEKVIEHIKITVENGTLVINQKDDESSSTIHFGINNDSKMKLYVKAPTLQSVSLTGSGNFAAEQTFNAKDLSISTTGSGDIAISSLQCSGNLKMGSEGSGDIAISNAKAASATLNTEGSGDIALNKFDAKKIDLSTSGSGDIAATIENAEKISVISEGSGDIALNCSNCGVISGSTSGSGDVAVHGSAKSCNISSSGSGDVATAIH